MNDAPLKLTYQVTARRVDAHGSLAQSKDAKNYIRYRSSRPP